MGLFGKKNPERVEVKGKILQCPICDGDLFWQREAQLNTALATFFNVDWANASATCVICAYCGYIFWFSPMKPMQ